MYLGPNTAPRPSTAAAPAMNPVREPQPSATSISGNGARLNRASDSTAPDAIEANIKADASAAASAMSIGVNIISCHAPFERLEACGPNHPRLQSLPSYEQSLTLEREVCSSSR